MSFDIHSHAETALAIGMKNAAALEKHAKPFVIYLVSVSGEPTADLETWFWDIKAAKDALTDKAQIRQAGTAFNNAVRALRHHAGQSGFYPTFPNVRSGIGETRWESKSEAKDRKAAEQADADAKTAAAVARHETAETQRKLAEMQALGPDDIATKIAGMVSAWSNGEYGSIVDAMASTMFALSETGGFTASWLAAAIADKVAEQPDVADEQTHVKAAA